MRSHIRAAGAVPNILPKRNRSFRPPFSPCLCRIRNAIERTFCRPTEFRRVATRYDKLASTFMAAIHIAATVCYGL